MLRAHALLVITLVAVMSPLYAAAGCWPFLPDAEGSGVWRGAGSILRFGGPQLSQGPLNDARQSIDSTADPQTRGPVTTKDRIDILLKEYDTLRADILLRSNIVFSILAVAAGILAWFIQRHKESWFLPTFFALVAIFVFIYWVNHQNIARAANRLKEIELRVNVLAAPPEGSPLLEWETKWGGASLGPFRQSPSGGVAMDPWLASILVAFTLCLASLVYKVISPWYRARGYKGVDLSGRWGWEFEDGGIKFSFGANIEQNAHELTGTATVGKSVDGGNPYEEAFRLEGSAHGGVVTLRLYGQERKSVPFAIGLFKVGGEDRTLTGYLLYRFTADEIRSVKIESKLCFVEPSS